jgi:hypothetical protein
MMAKELTAHIRALTAQMDDGEKEEFYEEAEKEGFWFGELPRCRFLLSSIFTL